MEFLTKMVQSGDILVCVRNGSSALIGKSCILPQLNSTTFGAFMSVLRGDKTGFLQNSLNLISFRNRSEEKVMQQLIRLQKETFKAL